QGEDFHRFLHRAAVFSQPVEQGAFEMFGRADLLDKGVDLTLMERQQLPGRAAVYWVAPVIRAGLWEKLTEPEKLEMRQIAYRWYDQRVEESEEPDPQWSEAAVDHALTSNNVRGACKHAVRFGEYLDRVLLYRERWDFQQRVIDRITEVVI